MMPIETHTYNGLPSISSITTQCLLKSTGFGTGKPRSCKAFMYANSLVAEIRDRYNHEAACRC